MKYNPETHALYPKDADPALLEAIYSAHDAGDVWLHEKALTVHKAILSHILAAPQSHQEAPGIGWPQPVLSDATHVTSPLGPVSNAPQEPPSSATDYVAEICRVGLGRAFSIKWVERLIELPDGTKLFASPINAIPVSRVRELAKKYRSFCYRGEDDPLDPEYREHEAENMAYGDCGRELEKLAQEFEGVGE